MVFGFLKKTSNNFALFAAEQEIEKFVQYKRENPDQEGTLISMSMEIMDSYLKNDFGYDMHENPDLLALHTPDFHKVAYHIKKNRDLHYRKGSTEYVAIGYGMVAFSILGCEPSHERTMLWNKFIAGWHQ